MMKKWYIYSVRLGLIILTLLVTLLPGHEVYAKDKTFGDLKAELTVLQNKKAKQDSEKKQTQSEINANMNKKIETEAKLEKAKEEIVVLKNEVEETEEEIEKVKKITENILVLNQELQTENIYASYITGASSMTDLVMRIDVINQLTDYNEEKLTELELLIDSNERKTKEIASYQAKLDEMIVEYEAIADKLQDELAEMELGALSLQQEIDVLKEQIKYYESINCKPGQTLVECDMTSSLNNSGWLKPVSKGRITSLYGYRVSPTAGASSNHKGIDIGIAEGTKVYGTANGKVAAIVRKSSCGGNMVYVQTYVKGKPYTYVFMHLLEVHVNVGDTVTVNTVVGLSGGGSTATRNGGYDRCSTGAHLHYGLAEGHYVSAFNSHTINPPGYPGLYQWFYSRY